MLKFLINNRKNLFIISISVILVSVLLISGCGNKNDVYKIGTLLPLTGNKSIYGDKAKKGMELAMEDVKEKMPELNIKILYEDSKFDVKEAVSSYHKLTSLYNIPVIITLSSDVSVAIAPLANKDKILQMAIVSSTPDYSSPDDYTFRTTAKSELEDIELAKAVSSRYNKVGLMYNNNERGIGHRNEIVKELKNRECNIVLEEAISPDGGSYRNDLLKVKQTNPPAVILITEAQIIGRILKQANESGITTQFYSTRSTESEEVIQTAGEAAEGIIYTFSFDPKSGDSAVKNIVERYKAKYGDTPDYIAAEAYDAVMLMAQCFSECGDDTECMKEKLFNTKDYDGLIGTLSFDQNGDVYYPYKLKTIKNGKFVPYQK